jgi:cyanate permease
MKARLVEQYSQVSMSSRWISGVWAFLGAPAAIMLVGYSKQALYRSLPNSLAFLYIGAFLPGVCIGLGLLALLSLVKSGWPQRAILSAVYGSVMYVLAETIGNPVLITHAALVVPR